MQLGGKFVYSRVDASMRHSELKEAFEILALARLCHRVQHTAGNGLPLGAEVNERFFKAVSLDAGLACAHLGLQPIRPADLQRLVWANRGAMAEQLVGQQLRSARPAYEEPRLFYWQRSGGRQGEIDYLIEHGPRVVPIEVKAGAAGTMKSLHAFMAAKGLPLAVRCDTNPLSLVDLHVVTTTGIPVEYRLLSVPLYMVETLPRLLEWADPG